MVHFSDQQVDNSHTFEARLGYVVRLNQKGGKVIILVLSVSVCMTVSLSLSHSVCVNVCVREKQKRRRNKAMEGERKKRNRRNEAFSVDRLQYFSPSHSKPGTT